MEKINFIDLQAQQARIRDDVNQRIAAVLDHGRYIMGPEITELEEKLASYVGVKHCISCASGTDALLMPLMALDIGVGDAVLVPSFTFISTAEVVALLGATPIFVDIDRDTFNIDVTSLREAHANAEQRGLKPKAVIPVDLFGQPADYEEIEAFAKEKDIFVIEDAAQGFGAEYQNKKACSFGIVGCTSFFPAKPLGCYGDGGAVFTDDDDLADKLRSIRVHGKGSDKYNNIRVGINGRCDTMQAAILLSKIEIFDDEIRLRNEAAARYQDGLSGVVKTPVVKPQRTSVWAQYTLITDDRTSMLAKLKDKGVPTAIYYPKPLHLQDAFLHYGYERGQLPVTEEYSEKVFSIPMHPYLTAEVQTRIVDAIRS